MTLLTIIVQNFRNYEFSTFQISPSTTFIIGENSRGKTSLLEAIYALLHGHGFRETREVELIRWEQQLATVTGQFRADAAPITYQVMLKRVGTTETGEKAEKAYFVDKTKQGSVKYSRDLTKAVLFTPDAIEILTGAPTRRRRYLDAVLSGSNPQYRKALTNYENALRKRNKLLETTRDKTALKEELVFWDGYLAEQAAILQSERKSFVTFCNTHPELHNRVFRLEYQPNVLTVSLLQERFDKEVFIKKTTIGPQKDDFVIHQTIEVETKNVGIYGSRSEQRLALFWLKQNEIRYLEQAIGKKPLLLLDDVFSELDEQNKERTLQLMDEYQTILTTTDRSLLYRHGPGTEVIELSAATP